jgi:hypothetical protein
MEQEIERWGVFEVEVPGKTEGNPFMDYSITAVFEGEKERCTVDGFYDGEGKYKVRFMPRFTGKYTYTLGGSFSSESFSGSFTVISPPQNNHGPVRIAGKYHFAYEDGTPYYSVGTTCYAWVHQNESLRHQTLAELGKGYFNKIRFCVFPKHYDFNLKDPEVFPYEGKPMDAGVLTKENFFQYNKGSRFSAYFPEEEKADENRWDFTRFNPEYFRRIEACIVELMKLGIEADLIIMHPYDRWGFSTMTARQDDLYWHYVISRFSAYRNVWWSLANEYDLMGSKTVEDWERYASFLLNQDPYDHLRSIHNCMAFYDYTRPWITHCSIQRQDLHKTAEFTAEWRNNFGKPVVLDEIAYEGNINHCWGNISGKELVRRFWEAAVRGGYAGHGETFLDNEDILWWSHGGRLKGESPERIRFLQGILSETPGLGLAPRTLSGMGGPFSWDDVVAIPEDPRFDGTYYLLYFGIFRPIFRLYTFNDGFEYEVEVIDTWDMSITPLGRMKQRLYIPLPGKEYMAIRLKKAGQ